MQARWRDAIARLFVMVLGAASCAFLAGAAKDLTTLLIVPRADLPDPNFRDSVVLVMNNLYCVSSETVRLALDVPQPIIVEHALRDGQFLCTVVVTPGFYYRLEASQDLFA